MKIIQPGGAVWTKEVKCTGKGWSQDAYPCGAILELDEADIIKRVHARYGQEPGTDYGFICPQCGCFTEMEPSDIPHYIRDKARAWRSDCGFLDELPYKHREGM